MNVEILRKDMSLLEKGINISNHMKRDNIKANRTNQKKSID